MQTYRKFHKVLCSAVNLKCSIRSSRSKCTVSASDRGRRIERTIYRFHLLQGVVDSYLRGEHSEMNFLIIQMWLIKNTKCRNGTIPVAGLY